MATALTAAGTLTEKFSPNVIPPAKMTTAVTSNKTTTTTTGIKSPANHHHHQNSSKNNTNGLSSYLEEALEEHHHNQHQQHPQQQVPIWVGLSCKLVSGISKSTTCLDLISSILPPSQDPNKYVIVEKWKKMERILDPSVKILKVWKAWGDQFEDVSFVLRSSPTADGYIDKKSSRKVHRKRSASYHQQKPTSHEEDCDKEGHRDAMEQLIKLVLTQGEAIQAQLKKLRQQEEAIEKYEEKMHKIRSSQMGENYVVETYLKDDATKGRRLKRRDNNAHGDSHHHHRHHHHHHRQKRTTTGTEQHQPLQVETVELKHLQHEDVVIEGQSSNGSERTDQATIDPDSSEEPSTDLPEELKEKTELMENIFQLNVRLTQEEERLVKLGLKIRKLSDRQRKAEWEELALQDISQELEHLKQVTNEQSQEIELNERDLTAVEQFLDDKHDQLAFLTQEIQLMDEQSEILQRRVMEMNAARAGNNPQQYHHHEEEEENQQPYPSSSYPPSHDDPHHHHHQEEYFTRATSTNEEEEEDETHHHHPHHHHLYQIDEEEDIQNQPSTSLSSSTSCLSKERGGNLNASIRSYTGSLPDHPSPAAAQFQQVPHAESCSSSCSNSSSICAHHHHHHHLGQKQCSGGGGGGDADVGSVTGTGGGPSSQDHQDNDSNSDTGISSLHSSVDESPMYVLDTLV